MNVLMQLEFELSQYDFAVQNINHYTPRILSLII